MAITILYLGPMLDVRIIYLSHFFFYFTFGMDIRNSNNFVVYTPPTHRLIADKQIPNACVKFATEKQGELLEKGIGRNFMTHLILSVTLVSSPQQ